MGGSTSNLLRITGKKHVFIGTYNRTRVFSANFLTMINYERVYIPLYPIISHLLVNYPIANWPVCTGYPITSPIISPICQLCSCGWPEGISHCILHWSVKSSLSESIVYLIVASHSNIIKSYPMAIADFAGMNHWYDESSHHREVRQGCYDAKVSSARWAVRLNSWEMCQEKVSPTEKKKGERPPQNSMEISPWGQG